MRRALGKGLSQLIAEQFEGGPTEVAIESVIPNRYQPRTTFDEVALEELAESIRQHGILQPIVVRSLTDDQFELIAGERRWRAAKLAGLKRIPVVVKAAGNQASLEIALVENLQRENIGALESAKAYRQLTTEFGLTQEQVAERVGKSRTAVTNTLRLLRLPMPVLQALEANTITEGHARALLGFDSPAQQLALLDRILTDNLSVRDVEAGVKTKRPLSSAPSPKASKPEPDPNWVALEDRVSEHLAAPVKISREASGRGKLVVDFYSNDDLDRILNLLGIK